MPASSLRAWLATSAVAALAASGACRSSAEENAPSPEAARAAAAEGLFRSLQSELVTTCGGPSAACHVRGTYESAPPWLGDPDPYASARAYRGILPSTRDASDSILLTQVDHAGPSLKRYASLYERVADWLNAELPPPPLPATPPFSVAHGFNNVSLHTVAPGLDGARITFVANENNGVLSLNALRVHAPERTTVTLEAPFFVILPRSGKVDANPESNGFQGTLTVPAGESAPLFSGKMILLRWDATGQLKVAFQGLRSSPGTGQARGCTALDLFTTRAVPAMRLPVDIVDPDEGDGGAGGGNGGTVVGKGSCLGCHAEPSSPAPAALQAMDLRALDQDPAAACAQARNWINFSDRSQSTLFLTPLGRANPTHPVKPVAPADPIIQGIAAWVEAENP